MGEPMQGDSARRRLPKNEYPQWSHLQVGWLILATPRYIVFLDDATDLDWSTTDEFDAALTPLLTQAKGRVQNRITRLQALEGDRLSPVNRRAFRRMLGEAMARVLGGEPDAADAMLDDAEQYIGRRTRESAQFSYALATLVLTAGICSATLILWIFRKELLPRLGATAFELIICAGAGALGACFSMLLKMRSAPLDPGSDRHHHYVDALVRLIVGMIGAVIAAVAVRIGILLPQLNPATNGFGGLVLACAIAGASERLSPALIERLGTARTAGPATPAEGGSASGSPGRRASRPKLSGSTERKT